MTTRTQTATSHYDVQKKRRSDELEYWRQNRLHLVKGSEVVMQPTPRRVDRGVLVGIDGDASYQEIAAIIRVHNFDSLYMGMRALLDPLNLFEEPPNLGAPDLTGLEWPAPDAGRPR